MTWDEKLHPRAPDGRFRTINWDALAGSLREQHPGLDLKLRHHKKTGAVVVDRVAFPYEQQRQGRGSAVMKALTDAADASNTPLALTPSDQLGGTVPRLQQFYGRHGFVPNRGEGRLAIAEKMVRRPQPMSDWAQKLSGAIDSSQPLRGNAAYDSTVRRVEWDGQLHGPGADQSMQAALSDWRWHYDEPVSAYLRGSEVRGGAGRVAGWDPPQIADTQERIGHIDRAMAPLPKSIIVYRTVSDPEAWIRQGHEPSYLPTTTDPSIAGHFVQARDGAAVARIMVPAGVGAVGVGPDEMEVLLERGLRYRAVRRAGGSIDAEILL